MKKNATGVIVIAAAILSTAAAAELSQQYVTGEGFSIRLPGDWEQVPGEVLKAYSRAMRDLAPGADLPAYDYGYQPSGAGRWLAYPYILLQVRRTGRVPEEELSEYRQFRDAAEEGIRAAGEKAGGLFSSLALGETLYDPGDRILWMTMQAEVEGAGPFKALVALKLTSEGFIQLMCYSDADEFGRYIPLFEEIVRGVSLDDRLLYAPRPRGPEPGEARPGRGWLWAAAAVALAALLVSFPALKTRRKP